MRCLYIDGQAGAAGDMLLAALLDLGVDLERLQKTLRPIVPAAFTLDLQPVKVNGIAAKRLQVTVTEHGHHRSLSEILALLERGDLSAPVRTRASGVFRRLAEAEAKIHSSTAERVHVHEVGANDALIDVVGAVWSLERLDIDSVYCAPLVLGSGVGVSAHGPIHYPAPAVMEILRGKPVRLVADLGETTTPTGAAILAEVAKFRETFAFTPEKTGYGAGAKTLPDRPNVLRATIGAVEAHFDTDEMWLGTSDIDNTRPEVFDWLAERLRAVGAVDVTMTDIGMKKNRRGIRVEALCPSETRASVAEVILSETGSLGVRWMPVTRTKLPRRIETLTTPWGPIRIKVAETAHGPRAVPEYDDCRDAASRSGTPLIRVIETVERLFHQSRNGSPT